MKQYLKYLAILSFFVVLTFGVGEVYVRSLPNPYQLKEDYMQQNGSEVETLILGTSHAYYGIDPEYLNSVAFNLANSSQNFKYDCYLLKRYADKYSRLKRVLLPVDYFSLFSKPLEEGDDGGLIYVPNYYIYMGYKGKGPFSKYNYEFMHRQIFIGRLTAGLSHNVRICSKLGWGTDFSLSGKMSNMEDEEGKLRAESHTYGFDELPYNLHYLCEIADFCKERSVELVLFTMPVFHTYSDHVDERQLAEMHRNIDWLRKKYNLSYVDWFNDSRFVSDDFYDSDHLSDVGAQKFTKILQKYLDDNAL